MTKDDVRRAVLIGQIIAQSNNGNPAAGLPPGQSFEAQAQIDGDLARGNRQGIPTDSSWFASILELFRFGGRS